MNLVRRPWRPLGWALPPCLSLLVGVAVPSLLVGVAMPSLAVAHEGEHGPHTHPAAPGADGSVAEPAVVGDEGAVVGDEQVAEEAATADATVAAEAHPAGASQPAGAAQSAGAAQAAAPAEAQPEAGQAPPGYEDEEDGLPPTLRSIPDTTWRRRARGDRRSGGDFLEPSHFLFELRFGPYSPDTDALFEAGGQEGPHFAFLGTDAQFYFGLEIDWLPLHIPYVGSLGAGFGWGYTSASGNTKVIGSDDDAGSETSEDIFPMHVSGILRIDGPLRKLDLPIVPYAKIGFGFAGWSLSEPDGDLEGVATGLHLALGGAIALNAFDRATAVSMYEGTGVHYAYVYGEWMLDDLGSTARDGDELAHMTVGTSTAIFGLALDF